MNKQKIGGVILILFKDAQAFTKVWRPSHEFGVLEVVGSPNQLDEKPFSVGIVSLLTLN